MQVAKDFDSVSFTVAVIRKGIEEWRKVLPEDVKPDEIKPYLTYRRGTESWKTDDLEEWFAEVGNLDPKAYCRVQLETWKCMIAITRFDTGNTTVEVTADKKADAQRVLNVFNEAAADCAIPKPPPRPKAPPPPPKVFIGHGHSPDWRKIKDHLQDKHGYKVEAYEVGARAGHTIRDVLDSMLDSSSFALLVMTAEDDGADGLMRARQNVIHEAGLFQGRLGFHRAIAVVESGVEVFSNLNGVDQIRYPSGHVENTFGEILAVLRREFGDMR